MNKQDFFKECNDKSVPLEDFKLTFCDRCVQPECVRSIQGKSKFEQRTSTWLERLFINTPRMDSKDSRYMEISSKNFTDISTSGKESSNWIDPKDLPKKVSVLVNNPLTSENQISRESILMNTKKDLNLFIPTSTKAEVNTWEKSSSEIIVERGATIKLGGGVSKHGGES